MTISAPFPNLPSLIAAHARARPQAPSLIQSAEPPALPVVRKLVAEPMHE